MSARTPTLRQKDIPRTLWLLLAAALLVRLLLAVLTDGYPYDTSCFWAWGGRLIEVGPAHFYSEGYFADYPPGYLWVLGLVALLRRALGVGYDGAVGRMLLVLVPSLCDGVIVMLGWAAARRWTASSGTVRRAVLLLAFSPLLLFDTSIWKQIDGAFTLPLLLCFWLLEDKKYLPAAFCYGAALAIKPQALLAGPVLAVCFLAAVAEAVPQGRAALGRAVGRIGGGIALALLPPLLLALPFYGPSVLPALTAKYWETAGGYPYATINAFNWMAALGGNWQPLDNAVFGPLTWRALGLLGIALVTLAMLVLAVVSWRAGRFSPLLLAAFYTTGIFTFAHCMHERYVELGVLLALLAALRWDDKRLYGAGFGLSLTGFLDLTAVYTLVGTDDEWLTSATSDLFARVVGFAATAFFLLLALTAWRIARHGEVLPLSDAAPADPKAAGLPAAPAWTRRELAALLALIALTAAVSFCYLGDLTAPQNGVDANGGSHTMTVTLLPHESALSELWVYPGISTANNGRLTVSDANGGLLLDLTLGYTTPFTWSRHDVSMAGPGPYTVTVTDGAVMELCFRDAAGEKYPLEELCCQDPLFDEQALVPQTISQLNSFYFDEIYHARTGYEQLHRLPVYETTHPPLGKDLIMLGIALFGMTGFGWRCAGTLFGVLLVPLAWLFARRLTGRPWLGATAGVLLALDFMRFSQSRIATIDIYGTFFILLSAYFMLCYAQSALQKGIRRSLLPMALGGLAFGLGCAAKWTGIYNGAGLAVLYFGVLWARWRQQPPDFRREFRTAALGGVTFYVALPACVYALAYLPYQWRDPNFGLRDLWDAQVLMYNYHTDLEATHGFESRWYTWLLDLRPVWYYSNGNLPAGTAASIAGMGGPVLWLAGLACILWLLWRQVSGHGTRAGAAVLILYGTQLVPWMLVTRCTFLYHYFPSSMFCLAAIVLALAERRQERQAKKAALALCAASLVLFVWFYPVLSGLPVPAGWLQSLRILPSFGF